MTRVFACEDRVIGGKTFKITVLSLAEARKAFYLVQPIIQVTGLDEDDSAGLGSLGGPLMAAMTRGLSEQALQECIALFGPTTRVVMSDEREVVLKDPTAQEELFAGQLELLFDWIAACVEINFAGVLAKTQAAAKKMRASAVAAAAKPAPLA